MYQVNVDLRELLPIRGLGGRVVFIGIEIALSVSPSVFPSINVDTIYLGFDMEMTGMLDNSLVHLQDGTAEPRELEYQWRNATL